MPQNGVVRGSFCIDGPHGDLDGSVLHYRAWDDEGVSHISGSGIVHPGTPDEAGVTLMHVHTMVSRRTVLINGKPPVLQGDEGHWGNCPAGDGEKLTFTVGSNGYGVRIEGRSVAVEGVDMMVSSTLHGGNGRFTNGGSPNVFIGR